MTRDVPFLLQSRTLRFSECRPSRTGETRHTIHGRTVGMCHTVCVQNELDVLGHLGGEFEC
jgi:hypothetical protein